MIVKLFFILVILNLILKKLFNFNKFFCSFELMRQREEKEKIQNGIKDEDKSQNGNKVEDKSQNGIKEEDKSQNGIKDEDTSQTGFEKKKNEMRNYGKHMDVSVAKEISNEEIEPVENKSLEHKPSEKVVFLISQERRITSHLTKQ